MASLRPGATVNIGEHLALLETWAASVSSRDVEGLRTLVYDRLGFRGDADDYHQAANSYLDEVLRRRQGMPITLAVVLLSLGRRIGVELVPIGAPGHFLVKEPVSGSLLDPFDRASEQQPSALAARMATLGEHHDLAEALSSPSCGNARRRPGRSARPDTRTGRCRPRPQQPDQHHGAAISPRSRLGARPSSGAPDALPGSPRTGGALRAARSPRPCRRDSRPAGSRRRARRPQAQSGCLASPPELGHEPAFFVNVSPPRALGQ